MFDNSVSAAMMEKALSGLWQRGQVITNNIANESTPGYKAKRVEFESLLKKELNAHTNVSAFGDRDTVSRIQSVKPVEYEDTTSVGRADGNNVDYNSENIELARMQIQYSMLQQKITGHYSLLKYAMTGGR